ncbi:hypothetical protein [Streptomyces sp. RKAG290]|uniref:hypothetical protein n=1 Tax=Streptomyces sp. RKAG290 TaxID=2888348 RepID=UPI0020342A5D|nr:hypothetical protein [Streptomyces sp. RKAG290]MCM2414012.1 hypothetical protein [Streptomyces sp. RKAG290]
MSDESTQKDVLNELGDDGLHEVARVLDTDTEGAQRFVGETVTATEEAPVPAEEPPLTGVATLGGGLAGGVLGKLSGPVAGAVAKRTGLPPATVKRGVELLLPLVLAALAKRSSRKK